MKQLQIICFLFILSFMAMNCAPQPALNYPETAKTDHVDVYFGVDVPDPYRWLEDDRSEATAAWVQAENEVTFGYLEKIPFRETIREALTAIWNYPKEGVPSKYGNRYFVYKNDGLQNQSVLYTMDSLAGEPRVFLDPNTLSDDGTTRVGGISVSHDYKYVAYTLSSGGSDWKEIRIRDVDGRDLPDVVRWIKFSAIAWRGDGFYYSAYDAPQGSALSEQNQFNKIYFHKLGTPQEADELVYGDPQNPLRYHSALTTDDERFLLLSVSDGTGGNTLAVKKLDVPQAPFVQITPANFEYEFHLIDNFGDDLYILTNQNAPRYKLMKVRLRAGRPLWETVIPESDDVLEWATVAGDRIVAGYLHNASSQVFIFDRNGLHKTELPLPGIGSIGGLTSTKESNEVFYSFSSYATPPTIFRIDNILAPAPEIYRETRLAVKLSRYITEQVWFTSRDSTSVPMFIVYKEGTPRNGKNPALLYGYGGFNNSLTPAFSIANLLFLENGGIYAVANLRGGGEFGSEWHKAGTKLQKQNVFDDFIAAAEYLIKEGYTSPGKLAIRGGSNGGLLVGACITQRPELFKVALPAVGVMDMLRFHKFTVGWGWVDDYGSSEESEEQFRYLLNYSPLHNIKPGVSYPATLITTADHDDRVVPAHSFKFAATLQAAQAGSNPVLIRIETMSGHGSSSTSKAIEEYTDMWAFTFHNLGMKPSFNNE
ncbi:MAG: prolyl oligopeptidase family serine peptidase [Prevotellaceae bacterium]|jgi:prolyl oligopeptidase|nr:prolyl oligopeptidase family serine peptidase [Prevotellaceae bacterium]